MTDYGKIINTRPLREIIGGFPLAADFLKNLNLTAADGAGLDFSKPLAEALLDIDGQWLEEFGLTAAELPDSLAEFLRDMTARAEAQKIRSLTILPGIDKFGNTEKPAPGNSTNYPQPMLTLFPGDVVSIVGATGSGKSRLLADIECLAQGDTPTKRHVLINGEPVDDERRFGLGGSLIAQLSQNMNFVMDLSVWEFLNMHASARLLKSSEILAEECFLCANDLAGEKFSKTSKVTELSGGQSRALMIADCAYISDSAVVLIDEIENAGVDRKKALGILEKSEKIVLIATHDPLLALRAQRRVIIKNGGIIKILETDDTERARIVELEHIDALWQTLRERLRAGERIDE